MPIPSVGGPSAPSYTGGDTTNPSSDQDKEIMAALRQQIFQQFQTGQGFATEALEKFVHPEEDEDDIDPDDAD